VVWLWFVVQKWRKRVETANGSLDCSPLHETEIIMLKERVKPVQTSRDEEAVVEVRQDEPTRLLECFRIVVSFKREEERGFRAGRRV
jgi:hypothetical protein